MAGSPAGDWDRFQVRNIGLAVQRHIAERYQGDAERLDIKGLALILELAPDFEDWSPAEKKAAEGIIRAKEGPDEALYLKRMQKHPKLRRLFLTLGSKG